VRPLLDRIELGHHLIEARELATMDAVAVEALRRAGILRRMDDKLDEISVSDLSRALRVLWQVEGRGLTALVKFELWPQTLGWVKQEGGEREVVLVVPTKTALLNALIRTRPTLALVPTDRHLTRDMREKHAPGAMVVIDVIDESLCVHDGRLARAKNVAPDAASLDLSPSVAVPRTPLPAKPVSFAGVERWNQVRICLINQQTVRVDVPGRKQRCSYLDLGMGHGSTREPTRTWEMLVAFCEDNGVFARRRFGTPDATKQIISRLAKELRVLFGLTPSPFLPYRTDRGWEARFQALSDLPSDDDDL
jgi:hypothetical protein